MLNTTTKLITALKSQHQPHMDFVYELNTSVDTLLTETKQLYNFKLPHWNVMHEARILYESDKYLVLELGSKPVEYCVLKHKTKYRLEKQ